jgi:hypothetical protein
MGVACRGDSQVIEQSGERQDFESLLSRHGIPHERFALHVMRSSKRYRAGEWGVYYEVTVIALGNARARSYQGTPAESWVEHFEADLERGAYRDLG